jgi:DNA-binding response OmpR family regulator
MNVLVLSSNDELQDNIRIRFSQSGLSCDLTIVDSIDRFEEVLKTKSHQMIACDYLFDGVDIWHLSYFISSIELSNYARPLFVIQHGNEIEVPFILAREHGFEILRLDDLTGFFSHFKQHYPVQYTLNEAYLGLRKRILIIEDDEPSAETLADILKGKYQVDVCHDGCSGIACYIDERHDLVLLDYRLPDINGYAVLEKIMDVDPMQPIIIMTADIDPEHNKNFILSGACQFMPKPLSVRTVRDLCDSSIAKAALFYQTNYIEQKFQSYFQRLKWCIEADDLEGAKVVLSSIERMQPNCLNEDGQLELGLTL